MKKKRIRCKILDFVLIHARMIHQALGNEPIIERERRRCSMIPDPVLDPNWKTYTTGRNGKDASYSFFPSSRNYIRKSTGDRDADYLCAWLFNFTLILWSV